MPDNKLRQLARVFRGLATDVQPSDADRALARKRLEGAIARESQRQLSPVRRSLVVAASVAVVALAVIAVQVLRPSALAATTEEIAQVIELGEPLDITDSEFVYTYAETVALAVIPAEMFAVPIDGGEVAYLLPATRETWAGNDGTTRISVTSGVPMFFDKSVEDAYYESNLDDVDAIGKTTTNTVETVDPDSEWPSEIEQLDEMLSSTVSTDRGIPEPVQYLESALSILRESSASPHLRADTVRLIGDVSDLSFEARSADTRFEIEYFDSDLDVHFRLEFTLDNAGYLRTESTTATVNGELFGAPAGTPMFAAQYSVPKIVATLPD